MDFWAIRGISGTRDDDFYRRKHEMAWKDIKTKLSISVLTCDDGSYVKKSARPTKKIIREARHC
jgi:hypothetical protein